jgi:nucleoside-diphosphate-sugar epimerase
MSDNILILGGTRFFGKRLVNILLNQGHNVTIGTRRQTSATFDASLEWLTLDRQNKASMARALEGRTWGVVYDQICGGPIEAANAIDIFSHHIGKYIFTSSIAVYDQNKHADITQSDFDPDSYPAKLRPLSELNYAKGKRRAEAVFHQQAPFPVVSVRFPIVLGEDDYTERLLTPIKEIIAGKPLYISKNSPEMSLISSLGAANFLAWLASSQLSGPVNASFNQSITPQEIVKCIGKLPKTPQL